MSSAGERVLAALGPAAVRVLFHLLSATYRYRLLRPERLEELHGAGPVVLALWHGQAFAAARFVDRRLHRGGLSFTVIASRSRDGELVASLCRSLGIPVVRGSTSRGGRGAMLALYRTVVRDRTSALIAPDGPRGPRHRAQAGAVLLAQFARAPIVALGFAADRAWRLGSWDRMEVPRPFARIAVAIGEPQAVARELSEADLEQARARLEESLEELTAEAGLSMAPSGAAGAPEDLHDETSFRPGRT